MFSHMSISRWQNCSHNHNKNKINRNCCNKNIKQTQISSPNTLLLKKSKKIPFQSMGNDDHVGQYKDYKNHNDKDDSILKCSKWCNSNLARNHW